MIIEVTDYIYFIVFIGFFSILRYNEILLIIFRHLLCEKAVY